MCVTWKINDTWEDVESFSFSGVTSPKKKKKRKNFWNIAVPFTSYSLTFTSLPAQSCLWVCLSVSGCVTVNAELRAGLGERLFDKKCSSGYWHFSAAIICDNFKKAFLRNSSGSNKTSVPTSSLTRLTIRRDWRNSSGSSEWTENNLLYCKSCDLSLGFTMHSALLHLCLLLITLSPFPLCYLRTVDVLCLKYKPSLNM